MSGLLEEARQGLLIFEQEALVTGVELDSLELTRPSVDDLQEAQRLLNAGCDF